MSARYKYSRYAMYTHIHASLKKLNLKSGKCLIVGDSLNDSTGRIRNPVLLDMLPNQLEVLAPTYPGVDMQAMPYADNTFDFVLTDQVLEHVRKPWQGVSEIHRVLKPKGIAVITSALLFPIHGVPHDYFRFTPDGLAVLCEDFSIIHACAGTGNVKFAVNIIQDTRGGAVTPGTELEKEVMRNNNKHMVSVWVIAEK